MGGCCCSSHRVDWNDSSPLYHYPPLSEERQTLSLRNGAASVIPTGLLVDTNLETSIPDTYRLPPTPLPYETNAASPPNNQQGLGNKDHSPVQINNSAPFVGEIKIAKSDENEGVVVEEVDVELEKSGELKKTKTPFVAPEECPTCLEEYDEENPKIITKCEHHFHLSCILEWMERSDTCPVCDKEMEINVPLDT